MNSLLGNSFPQMSIYAYMRQNYFFFTRPPTSIPPPPENQMVRRCYGGMQQIKL